MPPTQQQQALILIVDDIPTNMQVLATALSTSYRIKVATNGVDALKIAQHDQPDLILLDIMMPNMDGFEVCRRLKENPLTEKIVVIFVTADDTAADEVRGLNLGAVDYITKPFLVPVVKARIRHHIRLKQQIDSLELKSVDIFPWHSHFNTGIAKIDEQHQKLIQLLNKLASYSAFHGDMQTLDNLFNQLADYAVYHFQTEEAIWHEYFQGSALEIKHKAEHENFVTTVANLKNEQNPNSLYNKIDKILLFLVNWLAYHILENDKYMTFVVQAMQSGVAQQQAEQQALDQLHDGNKQLISIVLSAYSSLAANTSQLMKEAIDRKKAEQRLHISAKQLKLTVHTLEIANEDLKKQFTDSIKVFAHVLEMRPGLKSGQSKDIIEKALLIAKRLGLNAEDNKTILYAGLLMKIGKMSFPDTLLETPFYSIPLAEKERYLRHALEGEALLNELDHLKAASILIRHQYERYDGSGLPDRLGQQNIPLGSRILTVVSDYIGYLDGSMTGEELSINAAIEQLRERSGRHYDPDIVALLVQIIKETHVDVEIKEKAPEIRKSWRSSRLHTQVQEKKATSTVRVVEIPWPQLREGMDIESVYFGDKPYIRNTLVDKKTINDIWALSERLGKDPIIRIRIK